MYDLIMKESNMSFEELKNMKINKVRDWYLYYVAKSEVEEYEKKKKDNNMDFSF